MMCAVESGFMCLNILVCGGPCKKCFVAVRGQDVIYHHSNWKCVRPEPTEEEFQRLWTEREERMRSFREKFKMKYEKKCPRCGSTGTQEERQFGMYVTSCVGCWLPYVEWDTWKADGDEQVEVSKIRKGV